MDGSEITAAIDLAANMDDIVLEAVRKVIAMIQRVKEGFDKLPKVIKDGIPDIADAGTLDEDPDPANVDDDIADMDRCRGDIEDANAFSSIRVSANSFSSVREKAVMCGKMIESSQTFGEDCQGTIQSFLGVWDLNSAQDKVIEMCRLVRLGEMMKQFAEQIDRLIAATIAVMRAVKENAMKVDLSSPNKLIGSVASDVSNLINNMDDVKALGKKLKFWKK